MKYTTNLRIPYPEPADPPRGAEQMQGLAERVDSRLGDGFWGDGEATVRASASGVIHVNKVPELAAVSGFTMNADGSITCTKDGIYHFSLFGYTFETGGQNFQWSLALVVNGDSPLSVFSQEPNAIPFLSGPVACNAGWRISVEAGSTSAQSVKVYANVSAVSSALQLTPPAHALSYDLKLAGTP